MSGNRWSLGALWWRLQYAYWGLHYEVKWWLHKGGWIGKNKKIRR